MTREQAREKWEIIKAFGEGKTIQFFSASGDWLDLPENFNLPLEEDLRIKEEPSEKKLKWTELRVGDVIREKSSLKQCMVTEIDISNNEGLHIFANNWFTREELEKWEKVGE